MRNCDNLTMGDLDELHSFTSLQKVWISGCPKLTCLPKALLVQTLVSLEIDSCNNLMIADPDEELHSLTGLKIVNYPRLASRWGWAGRLLRPTSLRVLETDAFSEELESFLWPSEIAAAFSMDIQHDSGQYPLISLESLTINGSVHEYMPDKLHHLTALRHLGIEGFDGLETLPEWLGYFSSLQSSQLQWCDNLASLPSLEAMQRLTNLQFLTIDCCHRIEEKCKRGSGQEWHKISHIPFKNFYFRNWPSESAADTP
ncbi:putative disease resistance protein RGA1 isoform X2 [Actinidia eriantha]|uniref:putative disease resistance protein RGA1 isoform X2 n=1 Tax=Actinidia eriantha TaxID=165200 RepID=UPI00258F833E|nr:putative disease resistance protein RGA1 isoform X2 [Actinidia eriantha]